MMSSFVTLGGVAFGNTLVWGVNLGKWEAKGERGTLNVYRKYVTPTIQRWRGLRPNKVSVTRQKDVDGSLVFTFKDLSIVDFERQKEELQKWTETVSLMEESNDPNKVKPTEQVAISYQYYDITLTISDQNIKLGDIDFLDWNREDFEIEVRRKDETEIISSDSEEYKQALDTLKRYAKVTVNNKLTPNQFAKDVINQTSEWYMVDLFNSIVRGQVITQEFDVVGSINPHLQDQKYAEDVITFATEQAKKGNFSTFDNYYGVVEQEIKNEQLITKKTKERLIREIAAREKDIAYRILKIIGITLTSVLLAAGLILAIHAIFNISIIATIIWSTISLGGWIVATANYLGLASMVFGIFTKTLFERSRELLKSAKSELIGAKELDKKLTEELENIEKLKAAAKLSLESALKLESETSLDLSNKNIGDVGLSIINIYLKNHTNSPCTILLLAGNNISDDGITAIANLIGSNITSLESIDLKDNPGKTALMVESLTMNLSLTNLRWNRETTDQTIINDIDRQLVINRYIRGQDLGANEIRLKALFGEDLKEQIHQQALDKINSYTGIKTITTHTPDQNIKNLLDSVIAKNNFNLEINKSPKSDNLFKIYDEINKEGARKIFITNISSNDENKKQLLQAIKDKANFPMLAKLENKKAKIELLEFAIQENIKTVSDYSGIAAIASELLELEKIPEDIINTIFTDTKCKIGDVIGQVKALNLTQDIKDSIIQSGLKAYFIPDLRAGLSPVVKNELEQNFDLTDFAKLDLDNQILGQKDDTGKRHKEIASYVKFICERNKLKKLLNSEKPKLDDFIKIYKEIETHKAEIYTKSLPEEENYSSPELALDQFESLAILRLVNQDLGKKDALSCELLRDLNEDHRIALLVRAFETGESKENAYKKAVVVSKLIGMPEELFKLTGKPIQDIKGEIYDALIIGSSWFGLTSTDKTKNDLATLKNNLENINKHYFAKDEIKSETSKLLDDVLSIANLEVEAIIKEIQKPKNILTLEEEIPPNQPKNN